MHISPWSGAPCPFVLTSPLVLFQHADLPLGAGPRGRASESLLRTERRNVLASEWDRFGRLGKALCVRSAIPSFRSVVVRHQVPVDHSREPQETLRSRAP